MTVTIADLAQFSTAGEGLPYLDRASAIIAEYRFERAYLEETDCHDLWARIVFADGSSLFVSQRRGLRSSGSVQ